MAVPQVTLYAGDIPDRANDSAQEFSDNADDTMQWLLTSPPEYNQVAEFVNNAASQVNATANYVGSWVGLTGAYPAGTGVFHSNSVWVLVDDTTAIQSTEPSDINTDWLKSGSFAQVAQNTIEIAQNTNDVAQNTIEIAQNTNDVAYNKNRLKTIIENSSIVIYPDVDNGYVSTSGDYTSPVDADYLIINTASGLEIVKVVNGPASGSITTLDISTLPMTATIGGTIYDLVTTNIKNEVYIIVSSSYIDDGTERNGVTVIDSNLPSMVTSGLNVLLLNPFSDNCIVDTKVEFFDGTRWREIPTVIYNQNANLSYGTNTIQEDDGIRLIAGNGAICGTILNSASPSGTNITMAPVRVTVWRV